MIPSSEIKAWSRSTDQYITLSDLWFIPSEDTRKVYKYFALLFALRMNEEDPDIY